MPKIVMEEYEEFPVLPQDSILNVRVDEINVVQMDGSRGAWQKAEFKFKILSVPSPQYQKLVGEVIWGSSVPFRFTESPDNKLRQWVEAILGMELSKGFELDTDMLIGRECRAVTQQYDKKAKNAQGVPFRGHQVAALLPRATAPAMAGAPAQVTNITNVAAPVDPWAAQPAGAASGGWSDEPPF